MKKAAKQHTYYLWVGKYQSYPVRPFRDYPVIQVMQSRVQQYNSFITYPFQSFFGFGQSAEIDIVLEGQDTRKTAEIKTEDGKKERHYLYYDGETVAGKVRHFTSTMMETFYLHYDWETVAGKVRHFTSTMMGKLWQGI